MLWVGITGGIGSGKTSVSGMLSDLGFEVVDADSLARNATLKGERAFDLIVDAFGVEVVKADGEIDRTKLAKIVFRDVEKLKLLESFVHPEVQKQLKLIKDNRKAQGDSVLFYDVPLLFEKQLQDQFDSTVVVHCSVEQQIQRVLQRSSLTKIQVMDRVNRQLPIDEKVKLADAVIDNTKDLKALKIQVGNWLEQLNITIPKSSQG